MLVNFFPRGVFLEKKILKKKILKKNIEIFFGQTESVN